MPAGIDNGQVLTIRGQGGLEVRQCGGQILLRLTGQHIGLTTAAQCARVLRVDVDHSRKGNDGFLIIALG